MKVTRAINSPIDIQLAGTPVSPFINNYSLSFDGVDDYLNVGYIQELNNASSFTFSGWYKQTTLDQFNSLFESFVDANNWIGAYTYTDGNMYLQFAPGSASNTSYGYFDYSAVVTANTWFNIAVIYDGSALTNADKLKCYIDGVQISLTFVRIIPTLTPAGINSFNICRSDNFSVNFLGNSDEIALWDSVIPIGDVWDGSGAATDLSLLATPPLHWYRNGDNGSWKSPQWLIPNNENKDKVSNYSFDFDGVDDYISLASPTFDATNGLTLSCWVKYDGVGAGLNWLCSGGSTSGVDTQFNTRLISDGRWFNYFQGSPRDTGISGLADGNWHHIAQTVNYANGDVKFYKDGVVSATVLTFGSTYSAAKLAQISTSFYPFKGQIDEFALFNSVVPIGDLWDGSGEPATLPSGAVAHYKMGEEATFSGGVWTVPDAVGSNNGTSNGMTIEDRIGEAPNSENNALSYNMDEVDRVEDTP
jgi:hypothetical protein